jgi:hypothetical protein
MVSYSGFLNDRLCDAQYQEYPTDSHHHTQELWRKRGRRVTHKKYKAPARIRPSAVGGKVVVASGKRTFAHEQLRD